MIMPEYALPKPKLLLVGTDTTHTAMYYELIKPACSEVVVVSNGAKHLGQASPAVVTFELRRPWKTWQTVHRLRRLFCKTRPDIVHVHQGNSVSFVTLLALKRFGRPVVVTTWGSDVLVLPHKNYLTRWLVRYNLLNASRVTAVAEHMADAISELTVGRVNALVVNFGVDIPVCAEPKVNVVYSNRLHKPLYNVDRVVKDFAAFHRSNPDWKLVIAATGTETETLKHLVNALNLEQSVVFVGWLSRADNLRWCCRSTVYASVPDSDGTPVSLLEAMACGCVPVVSDIAANRAWVEDGVNGIVANDRENIFERLLTLKSDRIGALNKEIIAQRASRDVSRRVFSDLYAQLLQLSSSNPST